MKLLLENRYHTGLNGGRSARSYRECLNLDKPDRNYYFALDYFNPTGINTYQNPLQTDGQIVHAVNVFSPTQGVIAKRPGYTSFNASLGAQVNSLFTFPFQNSGTLYTYAAAGTRLMYSAQGTGAWTQATPGSIANNSHVGRTVFNNVLSIGDGVNNLLTSSDGINFSSPGSSPVAQYLANFHGRVYTSDGTSSNVQYSVTNDPTNWQNSGTSDSSFLVVASPGAAQNMFVAGDRLVITKSRGNMFSWDDTSLVDQSTRFGPSMPWGISDIDNAWFYPNIKGLFSFDGATRTLISNAVQRQFYNQRGTGMGTALFGTAGCATSYVWDYIMTMGTVTDDFTGRTMNNALLVYDYQKNSYYNWQFADFPTAMHSYVDLNNNQVLQFGNASGQVFNLSATSTSDNGKPIASELVMLFTYSSQGEAFTQASAQQLVGSSWEKEWRYIRIFFQPGDECNIQYSFSNTLTYQHLNWSEQINVRERGRDSNDYFQMSDGVAEIRFPRQENNMPRGRFLFLRIYDDSDNSAWQYFGCQIDATPVVR